MEKIIKEYYCDVCGEKIETNENGAFDNFLGLCFDANAEGILLSDEELYKQIQINKDDYVGYTEVQAKRIIIKEIKNSFNGLVRLDISRYNGFEHYCKKCGKKIMKVCIDEMQRRYDQIGE